MWWLRLVVVPKGETTTKPAGGLPFATQKTIPEDFFPLFLKRRYLMKTEKPRKLRGNFPRTGRTICGLVATEKKPWLLFAIGYVHRSGYESLDVKLVADGVVAHKANYWLRYIPAPEFARFRKGREYDLAVERFGEVAVSSLAASCAAFYTKGYHRDRDIPQRVSEGHTEAPTQTYVQEDN